MRGGLIGTAGGNQTIWVNLTLNFAYAFHMKLTLYDAAWCYRDLLRRSSD